MKIRYIAKKNKRIKKGMTKINGKKIYNFIGVECWDKDGDSYWWSYNTKKWFKDFENNEDTKEGYSTIKVSIHSVKAFVRFVKKHKDYLPKGTRLILVSNFKGHNVICTL